VPGKAGNVVNVQFALECLAVLLHRFGADAQFRRDLLVGPPFGDELEHFRLAQGMSALGFLNPIIYSAPTGFNDITTGSNPGCGTNGFTGEHTPFLTFPLALFPHVLRKI